MRRYLPLLFLSGFFLLSGMGPAPAGQAEAWPLYIWDPPVSGFTEESRGRTDRELDAHEARTGVKLPVLYREHMKAQNGGDVRFRAYRQEDFQDGLFLNGEEMAPLEETANTLTAFLEGHFGESGMSEALGGNTDRLFILSYMDWHRVLCLDYGQRHTRLLREPQVVLFNLEDMTEDFRAASYEAFVGGLMYYTDEDSPEVLYTLLPAAARASLRETALALEKAWGLHFILRNEDGRFAGFFPWYSAWGEREGSAYHIMLQENRYRAGTRPFPERDAPFIMSFEWAGQTPEACRLFAEERIAALDGTGLSAAFLLMSGSGVDGVPVDGF